MKTEQIDKIISDYPQAFEDLENFLEENMKKDKLGLAELEKLGAKFGNGKRAAAKILLAMGERFLYEFFDLKGIYVCVVRYFSVGEDSGPKWMPDVSVMMETETLKVCDTRQEAESEGFRIAFKLLQSKLG
jgi:hypothetical protein